MATLSARARAGPAMAPRVRGCPTLRRRVPSHPRRTHGGAESPPRALPAEAFEVASLVDGYESALQAFPLATKCVTSLVGFTVADVVAQTLSLAGPLRRRPDADDDHLRFDPRRTLANGVFGLAFYGPVSSAWYAALDANVLPDAPSSAVAVAAKTALDQIVWAPVLVASLFAWDLVRAGEPLAPSTETRDGDAAEHLLIPSDGLPGKLARDLLPALLVNWSFWPLFHVLNFRFVDPEDRVLYVNAVQVLFNVFLCWKASARDENGREGEADACA